MPRRTQNQPVAPVSDREKYRNRARLLEEASHGLFLLLKKERATKTWLAKRLGVTPPRISALLRGDGNLTLETLADAYLAFGRHVHLTLGTDAEEMRFPFDEKLSLVSNNEATTTSVSSLPLSAVVRSAAGPQMPINEVGEVSHKLSLVG